MKSRQTVEREDEGRTCSRFPHHQSRDRVSSSEFNKIGESGFADEARLREVTAMDSNDSGCLIGDGAFVIMNIGAIGCSDFSELGAGEFENFRETKSAADFHQLAP